ncbi:MAG: hypothetical protein GY725_03100 [bacterium]|nr:hypothetical protein [bacterium]
MISRLSRLLLVGALLSSSPALAGAFFGTDSIAACGGAECRIFVIAHPVGYTSAGIGGEIEVPVCIRPGDTPFVQRAIDEAIVLWNGLTPTTGNCRDCASSEDTEPIPGVSIMATTAIHELGHCAVGLGHGNFRDPLTNEINNFTAARDVDTFDGGADMVRGSRDDIVTPLTGPPPLARATHWYRISDNDPVVIDGTVIDSSTYAILPALLPAGSSWVANGNRYVSDLLGAGFDTQSVMHGVAVRNMRYTGLTADDTNTTRHGMTGLDMVAGTADDYTIHLALVDDCADAEIEVQWKPLGPPMPGELQLLGRCSALLDYIGPQPPPPAGRIHFAMTALSPPRIVLEMNSEVEWGVFYDGFETGDLTRWSSSQ